MLNSIFSAYSKSEPDQLTGCKLGCSNFKTHLCSLLGNQYRVEIGHSFLTAKIRGSGLKVAKNEGDPRSLCYTKRPNIIKIERHCSRFWSHQIVHQGLYIPITDRSSPWPDRGGGVREAADTWPVS